MLVGRERYESGKGRARMRRANPLYCQSEAINSR
jgi:hypothetical protein